MHGQVDLVALLAIFVTPIGSFIAVKVAVATLTATVSTRFDEILRRLDKHDSKSEDVLRRMSELEREVATLHATSDWLVKLSKSCDKQHVPDSEDE